MKLSFEIANKNNPKPAFLGHSQMGEFIYAFDWAKTTLGAIEQWPQSLITTVNIILNSNHPMWIGWGPNLTFLYNDAYISVLGLAKHPQALGQPAAEVWAEIWDVCGPLADKVMKETQSIFVDNVRLFMKRIDYLEEVYYSFSYSPIQDEKGNVKGLFCPSTPTTEKMLSERRLRTLRELSTKSLIEKTIESACVSAMEIMAKNPDDIPFALLYLVDSQKQYASLIQAAGLMKDIPYISPLKIDLLKPVQNQSIWPITKIIEKSKEQIISVSDIDSLPLGLADQRIDEVLLLPLTLPNHECPIGILIAGVNPGRKLDLDKEYRTFYDLLTQQIVSAIQNAKTYEDEKKRIEMLAELDKAKTLFFSNVSHEFRTPLTLMLSPLEDIILNTNEPLTLSQRERIELTQRNGQRLLKLVNSLLDFSRIEAKRMQVVFEPTDIAELTKGLVEMFRSTILKAGLELEINISPLDEKVYLDKEMWEKIIFNLLSNAFKFTLQGSIRVNLKKYENEVVLSVEDTGVGIPGNELPKIFERFHRVEGAPGRSYEGTGIGLALIHELIQLHHGTIHAESCLGQGSRFIVSIPLGGIHLSAENVSSRRETYRPGNLGRTYVEEASRWLPENKRPLHPEGATIITTDFSPNSYTTMMPRILVADDNADMRQYISRILKSFWEVETVEDGEAALQVALTRKPDLILSDAMMPKLDGFGLLKALRENAQTQSIPVILLSARAGEEAKIDGLKVGADDYLVKPFSSKELMARIEACLKITKFRKMSFQREQELLLAAQAAETNLQQIVNNLKDGFMILNRQWEFIYINHQALLFMNKKKEEMINQVYWELYPDVEGTSLGKALRSTMENNQMNTIEFFYPGHERWYENRIYPYNDGLCVFSTDITSRKKLEMERQQALELANQQQQQRIQESEDYRRKQTEFIDTLCHELRNPLNGIYGSVTLLKDYIRNLTTSFIEKQPLNELNTLLQHIKDSLDTIEHCSHTQKVIVDDVLDLSKLEANKVDLNPEPFDFKQQLNYTIQMFTNELNRKKLQIKMQLPDDLWLKADRYRFSQICTNLISNAVKFTHQGSIGIRVVVEPVSEQEAFLTLEVQDTGIGMTNDEMARLFQRFNQANRRTTSEYGGSGLGLLISKKLVEMMDGKIEVTSEKEKGTCFTVRVRIQLLKEEEKYQYQDKEKVQNDNAMSLSPQLRNKPILIVEDNLINQKILIKYLESQGCICKVAANGIEALKQYEQSAPDLIFMDIEMPEMNGLEATRQIRAREAALNLRPIPIIGLSGNARLEQIKIALEMGMDNYITKPYRKEEILKAIKECSQIGLSETIEIKTSPKISSIPSQAQTNAARELIFSKKRKVGTLDPVNTSEDKIISETKNRKDC